MNYQLDFSKNALKEINIICKLLDSYSESGGHRFLVELSDVVASLERFPLLGKEVEAEVRKVILHKVKYNVYYKVNESANEVRILSIVYGPHDR